MSYRDEKAAGLGRHSPEYPRITTKTVATLKAALFIHDSHVVWEACLSSHSLHKLSPCFSACCLDLNGESMGPSSRLIAIVRVRSRSKTNAREYHPFLGNGTATP